MIDEVKNHLSITEDDEFESRFGVPTINNLVDYIKNNYLALPDLRPLEQLSGIEPMLPVPESQGMPRTPEAPQPEAPPPEDAGSQGTGMEQQLGGQ